MLAQEHAQTAWEFLEASDREFASGDHLQASEKLWGAAAHALMAVMQERGMSGNSHLQTGSSAATPAPERVWGSVFRRALRFHAEALSREYSDYRISRGFIAADMFHRNFYNDFMDDHDMEDNRPIVHDFVERVLSQSATDYHTTSTKLSCGT